MRVVITDDKIVNGLLPDNLISEGTEVLDLRGCVSLTELPSKLPQTLKSLNLSGCRSISSFPDDIAYNIKEISISGCSSLSSLPRKFPESLEVLNINNCDLIRSINVEYLRNLRSLNVTFMSNLREVVSEFPKSLESVDFSGCRALELLSQNLPESIHYLSLFSCISLLSLPERLPRNLRKLILGECKKIESLPDSMPSQLEVLDLSFCSSLRSLPNILGLQNLKYLSLRFCKKIDSLPDLSDCSLLEIDLSDTDFEIKHFPRKLLKLCLDRSAIKILPELPKTLIELSCGGSFELESVSGCLPESICSIDFSQCLNLANFFSNIPSELSKIKLTGCHNLTFEDLESIPVSNVKLLDVHGCSRIYPSPLLMKKLDSLKANGCIIRLPSHFTFEGHAEMLRNLIDNACNFLRDGDKGNSFSHFRRLINRYILENPMQRGGIGYIGQSIKPLIEIIEREPSCLEWMECLSSDFLAGCINQPVAGFQSISAWISVFKASNIDDKICAIKQLMAIEYIKNFISSLPRQFFPVGSRVEVEAGNVLLREVHNLLLSRGVIDKPWSAIPQGVVYEQSVSSFVNQVGLIEDAFNYIFENVIDINNSRVINFLLETDAREIWQYVVADSDMFARERSHLQEVSSNKLELLLIMLRNFEDGNLSKQNEVDFLEKQNSRDLVTYYSSIKDMDKEFLDKEIEKINILMQEKLFALLSMMTKREFGLVDLSRDFDQQIPANDNQNSILASESQFSVESDEDAPSSETIVADSFNVAGESLSKSR